MKHRTRATAVVVHDEKVLTFLAIDPTDGREFHFLPGGSVEEDETAPECAERETMEETGFAISVDPATCEDKEYVFHWDGEDYACLTLFYKGRLTSPLQKSRAPDEPDYNKGVVWVPLKDIPQVFAYTPEVRDAVVALALS